MFEIRFDSRLEEADSHITKARQATCRESAAQAEDRGFTSVRRVQLVGKIL